MWEHEDKNEWGCGQCQLGVPITEEDNDEGYPICIDPTYDAKLSEEDGEPTCGVCSHNLVFIVIAVVV